MDSLDSNGWLRHGARARASSFALALALVIACGGDDGGTAADSTADTGSDTSAGTTASTTAGTTASTTAGTSAGTSASTSAGTTVGTSDTNTATETTTATSDSGTGSETGTAACGAMDCAADQYCDWVMNTCGTNRVDEPQCTMIPDGCPEIGEDPVCGCDGIVYSGECAAALLGVDVDVDGGCTPPGGRFACGYKFCDPATSYCQHSVSDVLPSPDGFTCVPLPDGCGDVANCDCLADEPCAEFSCEGSGDGLTVVCPGG